MNKKPGLLWFSVVTALLAGLLGCTHRPAYSEMEPNKSTGNQNQKENQNGGSQGSISPPPETPADQPVSGPAPAQVSKRPAFMDEATGGIKDLPAYPHAYRLGMQLGPMQGVNTMSLALSTTDQMEKITAFYERAIKEHNWTVVNKIIDPEFSEWTLKKGEANSAKVQVKKDPLSKANNIVIVRGEKMETTGK